jgi:hypothetical protein
VTLKARVEAAGERAEGDHILLRFVYAGQFDPERIWERYQERIKWKTNPDIITPDAKTIQLLQTGVLYAFGRDRAKRPVIVANARKLNLKLFSP